MSIQNTCGDVTQMTIINPISFKIKINQGN